MSEQSLEVGKFGGALGGEGLPLSYQNRGGKSWLGAIDGNGLA